MSFASNVKDELAIHEKEHIKDEMSAILKAAGNVTISNQQLSIVFSTENAKVMKNVMKGMRTLYDCNFEASIYQSMKLNKSKTYKLTIKEKVSEILSDLDLIEMQVIKKIILNRKRIAAFLSGCFMGCGSVNDPRTSNYHLELSFSDEDFAKNVEKLIRKVDFSPKIIKRRNNYVVYLKKAQEIADFLAFIGATSCYFEFEGERMLRDMYNSGNRIHNCDIANLVRTNIAANEQIKNIELIESKVGLKTLGEDLYLLATLRLENPELSLKELAEIFNEKTGKNVSKSTVNHMFIKLKNKADTFKVK